MQPRLALVTSAPAAAPVAAGRRRSPARFVAIELAIWAAAYFAHLAVRGHAITQAGTAVAHARDVVSVERALDLYHEAALQSLFAPVADVFSVYYMAGFGPVIAATAVWLGVRHRDVYRGFRRALLLSIALATVVFVVFPTAPPRLAGLGIHDTVGLSGHDTGSFLGVRFDPYAAVPSMHVGWSLLVAWFGLQAAGGRVRRALLVAHPVVMAATVTVTGNHFFLDSITGAAFALLALVILRAARLRLAGGSVLAVYRR
jgi:hypothetical protein